MSNDLDASFFTDSDQLTALTQDARASDTSTISSKDDAKNTISSFRSAGDSSPWVSLNRSEAADRLTELIDNPRLIKQGRLNLCGPASFLCMWNARDPVGFTAYATGLFNTGAGKIGNMEISPSSELLNQDYSTMLARMGTEVCPQADWMLLGAIRNSEDVFWQGTWTGDPDQKLAAMTRPEELASWLQATGIYRQVLNQANWATLAGIPHATGLSLVEGTDISLLIHLNLINAATGVAKDNDWLLSQFPNHFIVLLSEITQNVKTGMIEFGAWTWGTTMWLSVPAQDFVDNYYGAVIASMPST